MDQLTSEIKSVLIHVDQVTSEMEMVQIHVDLYDSEIGTILGQYFPFMCYHGS